MCSSRTVTNPSMKNATQIVPTDPSHLITPNVTQTPHVTPADSPSNVANAIHERLLNSASKSDKCCCLSNHIVRLAMRCIKPEQFRADVAQAFAIFVDFANLPNR